MAETMNVPGGGDGGGGGANRPSVATDATASSGLYFQIVCDPGHERTSRELRELPRESRERVWADMTGDHHPSSSTSSSSSSTTTSTSSSPAASEREDDSNNNNSKNNNNVANEAETYKDQLRLLDEELKRQAATNSGGPVGNNNNNGSSSSSSGISSTNDNNGTNILEWALRNTGGIHKEDFRLMFLKAEDYDPVLAAQRMARHYEQKASLFGRHMLLRETIRLQDLSSEDIRSLRRGALQFLPRTDRAGRLVLVGRYKEFAYKERENLLRAIWYMLMSAAADIHQHGLVIVGYEVGEYVPADNELLRQVVRLVRNLPIRILACHSCYSESPMHTVLDLVVHMISRFSRLRFRMHHGSHQECRYRLLTMGIPVKVLPVDLNGTLHLENHTRWLQFRILQEKQQQQQHYYDSNSATNNDDESQMEEEDDEDDEDEDFMEE